MCQSRIRNILLIILSFAFQSTILAFPWIQGPTAPDGAMSSYYGENIIYLMQGEEYIYLDAKEFTNSTAYEWRIEDNSVGEIFDIDDSRMHLFLPETLASGSKGKITVSKAAPNWIRNSALEMAEYSFILVRVPAYGGAITGPAIVYTDMGSGSYTYSIPAIADATSYNWIMPEGIHIVENLGNSITVQISSSFTRGEISVCGQNSYRFDNRNECQISGTASVLNIEAKSMNPGVGSGYLNAANLPNASTRVLNSNVVGSTPGMFDVSNGGDATYQIPIFIAPGSAGMQPSVSISYNSAGNNGLLGTGWELMATSAIVRTGKNLYLDGVQTAVNFTADDQFALDGNRLLATSGQYGNDNTTYQTEFESFSQVTSLGQAGTGPQYFIVRTKDGKTLEYGKTADSRIEEQNSVNVCKWYLNKVIDQFGNFMIYNYREYQPTGEARLQSIEYTGTASLTPYNKIEFFYQQKTDSDISYVGGSIITDNVLLSSIVVTSESSLVRAYDFKYTLDVSSKLVEVIERASDNTQYNSTIINWGSSDAGVDFNNDIAEAFDVELAGQGDFNGDGKKDLMFKKTALKKLCFYTYDESQMSFVQFAEDTYDDGIESFDVFDLNQDGKDDVFESYATESMGQFWVRIKISMGNKFDQFDHYLGLTKNIGLSNQRRLFTGDFDGNGIMDLLIVGKYDGNSVHNGNGVYNGEFVISSYDQNVDTGPLSVNFPCSYGFPKYAYSQIQAVDVNGDGKTELLYVDIQRNSHCVSFNGTTFVDDFPQKSIGYNNSTPVAFSNLNDNVCNLNNDGYVDIFTQTAPNRFYYLGTGKGFAKTDRYIYPFGTSADFNGDGKMDELKIEKDQQSTHYYAKYNLSDHFSEPQLICTIESLEVEEPVLIDLNGDGADDLVCYYPHQGGKTVKVKAFFMKNDNNQRVTSITNGFNQTINIEYKPLTSSVYTKGAACTFPLQDKISSAHVVSSVETSDGVGGLAITKFAYQGLINHLQGRGSLGFSKITKTDLSKNIVIENTYALNDTYLFQYLKSNKVSHTDGSTISTTDYTNATKDFANKRFFSYTSQIVSNDLLQNIIKTTTLQYDHFGNQTHSFTNYGNEGSTQEDITYVNGGAWCLSKPETITQTKVVGSKAPFSCLTNLTYNSNGSLSSSIVFAGKAKSVTTSYTYNSFGLPATITTTGGDVSASPIENFSYDTKGRFQTSSWNSLLSSSKTYDGKTGNVLTSYDFNGLVTRYTYDGFGKLTQIKLPDGNTIVYSTHWNDNSGSGNALFFSNVQSSASAPVTVYYDQLGRPICDVTVGFDGRKKSSTTTYLANGNVGLVVESHFEGDANVNSVNYAYDKFGRVTLASGPTSITSYAYNGRTTTTTNELTAVFSTKTIDAMGQIITASDAGGNIQYEYASLGKPEKITAPGNMVTSLGYDDYGNQTSIAEPNVGVVNYTYNAFRQLVTQDKNGTLSSMTYDAIGRPKTVTEPEGITTYYFDNATRGKGLIGWIEYNNGTSEYYNYDALSRLKKRNIRIEKKTVYTQTIEYNSAGLPSALVYPSGFTINYIYNENFYLSQIKRADTGTAIWTANAVNAQGQVEQFTLGNNLTTTNTYHFNYLTGIKTGVLQDLSYLWNYNTGNLTSRKDLRRNLTETFTYDPLDRLTQAAVTGGETSTFSYMPNGNVNTSSVTGIYGYDSLKPHVLTSITNPATVSSNTDQAINYQQFSDNIFLHRSPDATSV